VNFKDLFRKCFGGGRAELVLEEGVDILEAGIDIVARPPGKKLRTLALMSGGEKTMTTIALLLAIFKSKPSPFCILDEVDAPLDDANVRRFTVLLEDFLQNTQFIIITHNKVTMAQADILYGVTMEERGVSKRVAVSLDSYDPEEMEALAASTSG
jgi:chromosome segregation protein